MNDEFAKPKASREKGAHFTALWRILADVNAHFSRPGARVPRIAARKTHIDPELNVRQPSERREDDSDTRQIPGDAPIGMTILTVMAEYWHK